MSKPLNKMNTDEISNVINKYLRKLVKVLKFKNKNKFTHTVWN